MLNIVEEPLLEDARLMLLKRLHALLAVHLDLFN